MFNIKWKDNKRLIILFLFFLIIFNIMVPFLIGSINFGSNSKTFAYSDINTHPNPSDFPTYNYTQILSEEKYALGNITVKDIDLEDLEGGIYVNNNTYSDLWEDYESNALNISRSDLLFIETTEFAVQDNLNEKVKDRSLITVKINESLEVTLNNPEKKYLIYHTRLFPSRLLDFFVDDGTDVDELDSETDYTIDDDGFIFFNYTKYFQPSPIPNFFNLYLTWEYDIEVDTWELSQETKPTLNMKENEVNLTIDYNYYFVLNGKKSDDNINNPSLFASNIYFALTVDLPDKDLLSNHVLELNNESVVVNNHLTENKSISILLTDSFSGNQSIFSLNFTTVFTIKFINPVGETWAIDRLFAKRNNRERVYFPSIVSGPKRIFLKFLTIYEPSIYYEEVISSTSLFERGVAISDVNTSITGKSGINIGIPYLILGETCPTMIKYKTSETLKIVIFDNIKMPLMGVSIEVFYFGLEFGTYISNNQTKPLSLAKSNENGEIYLYNVPHGNYTIKVYNRGELIKEANISTYKDENVISTNIPHFPLWMIIFGIINASILIIGSFLYLKYKNKR